MITRLAISNFKSVRQLDVKCKKVNLFIGEPNAGKSNILEALGLLSWTAQSTTSHLSDYVRFQSVQDLFYDQLMDREICIALWGALTTDLCVRFEHDGFELLGRPQPGRFGRMEYTGEFKGGTNSWMAPVKFFRFSSSARYDDKSAESLRPPNGSNLFSVVFASTILRETMIEFFRKYGLRVVLKPTEKRFELQKQADDLVISFPYSLASDTLRRIIFYTMAMASNKDSVLVFEEPESNAFPYYTKYLGERIALDETNQFFVATHNPYLLSAIIEKARKEDVQVFITYFKDYQTLVRPLSSAQVAELMEADPFFGLERFIEEAQ